MLNSILANKFPSKDQFQLATSRVHPTSAFVKNSRDKANQVKNHGYQPKGGGVLDLEQCHLHVDVKHVHFANGCKEDNTRKCVKSNGSGSKATCLLDLARSNDGNSKRFLISKMNLPPCWEPRLQYLLEMDMSLLKQIHAKPPDNKFVYFCENQPPLNLGQGPDYSCTYLGIMNDGMGVVVKKINKKRVESLSNERQHRVLASINDPSLAKICFISSDKTHYYIVRELCEHSIAYHLKMRRFIPVEERPALDHGDLCYKIACAVAALHKLALSHKSLKPENIFLTDSGVVKLADYHMHKRCSAKKKQYVNVPSSLAWLPSEAHTNTVELTLASDVSALGMVFYWIITEGGHPFGDHLHTLDTCVKNCKSGRYNLKPLQDPFAHHLLQHMIYKEPEKRLTIREVINHPYFWTENKRIEYVQLIAKTYCRNFEYELKEYLMEKECAIGKSTPKTVKEIQIDFDIDSIMKYISAGITQNDDTPAEMVLHTWPGFVFEMYNHFSLDDLRSAEESSIAGLNSLSESNESALKPCLSVDSGVCMTYHESNPYVDDPFALTTDNQFERRQRFISGDSGCCSFSDPAIDLISPVADFSKDEPCFESPDASQCKDTVNSIDETCHRNFVDNLNLGEKTTRKNEHLKEMLQTKFMLWTDMDELD